MSPPRRALSRLVQAVLRGAGYELRRYRPPVGDARDLPPLRAEFAGLTNAGLALQSLLEQDGIETVLDIGCGAGEHARLMLAKGKRVTAVDYGRSIYFAERPAGLDAVVGDFNTMRFETPFDAVWASHVLEHQLDPHGFLVRCHAVLREGGWLAVTVPPHKDEIVGGHVSLWNGGLLLYRLVLAGFDCREARVATYGYNVSVLVAKRSVKLPALAYDAGDVDRLAEFLPAGLGEGFEGRIVALGW